MVALDSFPTSRQDTGEAKWKDYAGRLFSNGVVRGIYAASANGDFKPYADSTGMVTKVGPGFCVVGGIGGESAGISGVNHAAAHASQHRYDRIVARLSTTAPYTIDIIPLTGNTSSTQAGALAAMAPLTALDISLGYTYIAPATSSITAASVTVDRTWAAGAGFTPWVPFTTSFQLTSGSGLSLFSVVVTKARTRFIGSSCEVSILASIALSGTPTGGLVFGLPFAHKSTGEPLEARAFNNIAWAQTTVVGGSSFWGDIYAPLGQTWPTDGVARNVSIRGSYEIAASA